MFTKELIIEKSKDLEEDELHLADQIEEFFMSARDEAFMYNELSMFISNLKTIFDDHESTFKKTAFTAKNEIEVLNLDSGKMLIRIKLI